MILLAHPSGNNFVREAAMALLSADVLTELHLGIAACGGNAFAKLSRLPGMAEIRRRTYDSRLYGSLEILTLARGLRILKLKGVQPTTTIIGDGPDRKALKQQAINADLQTQIFLRVRCQVTH